MDIGDERSGEITVLGRYAAWRDVFFARMALNDVGGMIKTYGRVRLAAIASGKMVGQALHSVKKFAFGIDTWVLMAGILKFIGMRLQIIFSRPVLLWKSLKVC